MPMTGFDYFADDYEELLNASIGLSGEKAEYFAAYKAKCLADLVVPAKDELAILDFGCGTGVLTAMAADLFSSSTVYGVDVSLRCAEVARVRFSELKNVVFSQALPDSIMFDLIYLANVFHHIPSEHRSGLLQYLGGLLKPYGKMAIFEHNPWNPLTRRVVNICPLDVGVTLISRASLVRLAHDAGLNVTDKRYIVFFPHLLRGLRRFERFLGFLPLGAQYMIVLTKGSVNSLSGRG